MDSFFELVKFGNKLREYRQKIQESITQVGSAVGIDRSHLSKLENGHERPSKQVLLLLIRHFSLSQFEASELWNLAGYPAGLVAFEDLRKEVKNNMDEQKKNVSTANQMEVKVPENSVVLYTDTVFVTRTDYGIVFDFAQGVGPTNERRVVSRIGMSMEHAKDLVNVIQGKINETKISVEDKKGKKVN
jgi:transcriptional regulator with XRE-family HTH domain